MRICFMAIFILFSYCSANDFSNYDLSKRIMRSRDFAYSTFNNTSFFDSFLVHCRFLYSYGKKTIFSSSNLEISDFFGSYFEEADFSKSNLRDVDFCGSKLIKCNFTNANLSWSSFHGAKFDNIIVTNAIFKNCYGLTNEQKMYLIENGALEVPMLIVSSIEEFEKIPEEFKKHTKFVTPKRGILKKLFSKNKKLSNKEKMYLIENGAKDVPNIIVKSEEEFEEIPEEFRKYTKLKLPFIKKAKNFKKALEKEVLKTTKKRITEIYDY